MSNGVMQAYADIRRPAQEKVDARSGKTRVVVQVGHCSQAVGAGEVAEAFKAELPDSAYLVVAGCDGACFAGPQVVVTTTDGVETRYGRVTPQDVPGIVAQIASGSLEASYDVSDFFSSQHRVTAEGMGELDSTAIDEYLANGGFEGLANALSTSPEDVIDTVGDSGLRGRGGAYFPAAIKWRGARSNPGRPKYLVVNCEEGEPGIFKDRHIMEGVPCRLLEGSLIAAYAAGLDEVYLYINAEANLSAQRMQSAIDLAAGLGLIDDDVLGSGFSVKVEIRRGAGGYVCGDETTMLNTMEGWRREPRSKDPLPVVAGLWAKPTVINNAETISSVPFIMSTGGRSVLGGRYRRRQGHQADQPQRLGTAAGDGRGPDGHNVAPAHLRRRRRA